MSGSHTVAAIDCGTNSIRLLIASADSDGRLVEQARELEMVRLGQGVDSRFAGRISRYPLRAGAGYQYGI